MIPFPMMLGSRRVTEEHSVVSRMLFFSRCSWKNYHPAVGEEEVTARIPPTIGHSASKARREKNGNERPHPDHTLL